MQARKDAIKALMRERMPSRSVRSVVTGPRRRDRALHAYDIRSLQKPQLVVRIPVSVDVLMCWFRVVLGVG